MQKVYIDVTSLIPVDFITGIQRVVKNVTKELGDISSQQLVYLNYVGEDNEYEIIDSDCYYECLKKGNFKEVRGKRKFEKLKLSDMNDGDIFFDIDSAWNNTILRRSILLPILKANGVKLVVYIYDIIPITNPEYCHIDTINNFMNYIGAYLQYADRIIVSAQSTLDQIYELADRLNIPKIEGNVSWLGSDFAKNEDSGDSDGIKSEVIELSEKKYVLIVGTIEPRKNHKFLMDAFSKKLYDDGFSLVFAGKIGWNVEELEKRIKNEPHLGSQFFFLTGLDDKNIDYLYKNAFFVAFPTFNEGFGLPIIESFQRGTPVVASRIPVLQEVGGDICKYFDNQNVDEFISLMEDYLDEKKYFELRQEIKRFVPFTWRQTAEKIDDVLKGLAYTDYKPHNDIRQLVLISESINNIRRTLKNIEETMGFIDEVVVAAPQHMMSSINRIKNSSINLLSIPLEKVIYNYKKVSTFVLQREVIKQPEVRDTFIWGHAGCINKKYSEEMFLSDNNYYAYTEGSLNDMLVDLDRQYDSVIRLVNSKKYLNDNKCPQKHYASSVFQIIDKKLFQEISEKIDAEYDVDLMCMYFNYVHMKYPGLVIDRKIELDQSELYSSYYSESDYDRYLEKYKRERGYYPAIVINNDDNTIGVHTPKYIDLTAGKINGLPVKIIGNNKTLISYRIYTKVGFLKPKRSQKYEFSNCDLLNNEDKLVLPVNLKKIRPNDKLYIAIETNSNGVKAEGVSKLNIIN